MKIAVVFPGQGSQSPGMLSELASSHGVVKETFAEASELLGYDLWDLVQNGTDEQLRQTEITQPAMFVAGMAVWRVWCAQGVQTPVLMAGHSLGEYTALTAAGAIPFEQSVKLVALRGRLMADAVKPGVGGMAALLGMEDDAVVEMCESLTTPAAVVEAVNFNSPGQVVISGHLAALENACLVARENGAKKAMVLPVSVPNHSSLMQPAVAELAAAIEAAKPGQPLIGVLQNASASVPVDDLTLVSSLKSHMVKPVYWTDTIRNIKDNGVETIVELGPGKVLSGLCKRIDRSLTAIPVEGIATFQRALEAISVSNT